MWAVKHSHIGDAFFDLDAAAFLCTQLQHARSPAHSSEAQDSTIQRSPVEGSAEQQAPAGPARPHKEPSPMPRQADDDVLDSVPDQLMIHDDSCHSPQAHHTTSTLCSSAARNSVSQGSAAEDSATQEVSAAQKPSACADVSATHDSADEQAYSAAQTSTEGLNSPQDPNHSQHQLPQRSRQQRRGKHRRTDKNSKCQDDQPDPSQAEPESKVKAERVCNLCIVMVPYCSVTFCPDCDAACCSIIQDVICTEHKMLEDCTGCVQDYVRQQQHSGTIFAQFT